MMPSLDQMIEAFCNGRPAKEAYELLPAFLRGAPDVIELFVDAVLARQPDGGTFLDAALSHIPDDAFDRLIDQWLPLATSAGMTDAIEALITYASLQRPEALRSHLDELRASLDSEDVAHVIFPRDHFPPPHTNWSLQGLHPTWHLAASESIRFGGAGSCNCGLCGGRLHNLLELPENRVGLSESSLSVSLQTCLSCLGWEKPVLYYRHGESGDIMPLDKEPCTPQFPAQALRECTAALAVTPARWRRQDWSLSNGRENLNRIGGRPSWVQGADYPNCPCCNKKMHFMLQLDSNLPSQDGEEWLWGSGGVAYGFFCSACRTTAYLWQCT